MKKTCFMFFYESLQNMFLMFFFIFSNVFVFLMSCFCCFWNKKVQNFKYDAFLMGKDSISWTERVFCSIIDFIWFVLTVLERASYLNG